LLAQITTISYFIFLQKDIEAKIAPKKINFQ